MNITRRDLLKFIGGGAVGTFITPIPWKLLRDTSVWSQNWPGVPVPKNGETTWRTTSCTLCPLGCGVRARCINGEPVTLAGIPRDPVSAGALCALGVIAHQLSYHPLRLRSTMMRDAHGAPVAIDTETVINHLVSAMRTGTTAILDGYPGRSMSNVYRDCAASLEHGLYLVPPSSTRSTGAVLRSMFSEDPGAFVPDITRASVILSFGAPLLDGWGTAHATLGLVGHRTAKVIQIEPSLSRTGMLADRWVAVTPGTEGTLALGIAHLLQATGRVAPSFARGDVSEFLTVLPQFTPDKVASLTGVPETTLRQIASEANSTTIAIGGGDPVGGPMAREDEIAINALNLMLGNINVPGGFCSVPATTAPDRDITEVPDRSIAVLILDGSPAVEAIPWPIMQQKLVDGATVVSLSPVLDGHALHAGLFIPSASPCEALTDTASEQQSSRRFLRLATPLRSAPAGVIDPVALLARVRTALGRPAGEFQSLTDAVKHAAGAVRATGRGSVYSPASGHTVDAKSIASDDAFVAALSDGGVWYDDVEPAKKFTAKHRIPVCGSWTLPAKGRPASMPLTLVASGPREAVATAMASPLMCKITQESELRPGKAVVTMNPATMAACGLTIEKKATLTTAAGSLPVSVKIDPRTAPGCVEMASSTLTALPGRSTWRLADASITEEHLS